MMANLSKINVITTRSNKILQLLDTNKQANTTDERKHKYSPPPKRRNISSRLQKDYVELFDQGRWEELDRYLRYPSIGENVKKSQPSGEEPGISNSSVTLKKDKIRKRLFGKGKKNTVTPSTSINVVDIAQYEFSNSLGVTAKTSISNPLASKNYKSDVKIAPDIETLNSMPNNSTTPMVIPVSPHSNSSPTALDIETLNSMPNNSTTTMVIPVSPHSNSSPTAPYIKTLSTMPNNSTTTMVIPASPYSNSSPTAPDIKTLNSMPNNSTTTMVMPVSPHSNSSPTALDIETLNSMPNNSTTTMVIPVSPHSNSSPTAPDIETLNSMPNNSTTTMVIPVSPHSNSSPTAPYIKTLNTMPNNSTTTMVIPASPYSNSSPTAPDIKTLNSMPNNSTTTMVMPVSPHSNSSPTAPDIETLNSMPNNSTTIMVIPVSPYPNSTPEPLSSIKANYSEHCFNNDTFSPLTLDFVDLPEDLSGEDCTQSTQPMKKKRKWDRKNYCLFCKKLITNFSKHMMNIHGNQEVVMKYCAILDSDLKIRKQRRQAIFDELRKRGNFEYNQMILRDSITQPTKSMLLPVKRSKKDDIKSAIHCKLCLGMFSRKTFYKHASHCGKSAPSSDDEILSVKNLAIKNKGLELNPSLEQASQILTEKIIPLLRKDMKGITAISDPLIVSVASDFLSNHSSNKDKYNITSKMRDAGSLLLKMREKDKTIINFTDCFDVKQIDNIMSCVQELSQNDSTTGTVGIIGMPARLSWVINESCSRLIDNIISDQSFTDKYKENRKTNIMDFQTVIRRRWKYAISTNAERTRKKNAMKKDVVMPLDSDIKLFLEELTKLEEAYSNTLRFCITISNYERLCEVIIGKLIVINRRRSGEVANAELEFYMDRPKGVISDEIVEQLSDEEKTTLDMFEVFLIPGKTTRAVPILIAEDTAQNIDLIISCRPNLGITQSNKLLFARPGTNNAFIGATIIRKFRNSIQLLKPEHMTATGLRHHCATMSHVFAKKLDKEDLAEFMGHSLEVHKKNYRYPLEVIQRGKIAPHLMQLAGVNLKENGCRETEHIEQTQSRAMYNNENEESDKNEDPDYNFNEDPNYYVEDSDDNILEDRHRVKTPKTKLKPNKKIKPEVKKHKPRNTRWSEEEKTIVIETFKDFIRMGRNPGTILCQQLISDYPLLSNRTWAQVNTLMDNYNKGKVALPIQYQYLRNDADSE